MFKAMCFKKTTSNQSVLQPEKTAILFGINNYPGSENDLNGCLNDVRDVANFLSVNYPGFVTEKFTDSKVTRQRFRDEVKNHITAMSPGNQLPIAYSGHGTYGDDPSGVEKDGYIEA